MRHRPREPRTLTERQEIFCRHVARGASGAAAARAAGYAPGNAAQQGSNLLQQPHVRLRIEELRMRREGNRSAGVSELVDVLRLLMRRAIKAGDHRAAIRCIEVEARLCGLFPDRAVHDFAGADPLLDMSDGRPAGMIPDRLFDEWDEEDEAAPTPTNPEETPHFPMDSSRDCHAGARPGHPDGTTVDAPPGSPGRSPAMTTEEAVTEQPAGGLIEPVGHDGFEPEVDPVEARIHRVATQQAAEQAGLVAQCPPRATNPAAPKWARSRFAQDRAFHASRHGWDNAWADEPWTPPHWLSHVEVRDSRALAR